MGTGWRIKSDEAGRMEVYVRPYPRSSAPAYRCRLLGGTEPAWSRDGRELFYRAGDSLMMASVALSPTFAVTGRRRLFTGSFLSSARFREYDVTPDGQHFVMIRGGSGTVDADRAEQRLRPAGVRPQRPEVSA